MTQGTARLADHLEAARTSGFVARTAEQAAFAASLAGTTTSRVHFVHGPGGIGKSTLLDAFARESTRVGRRVVRLEGCEPISDAKAVLSRAERRSNQDAPVLLIDGYDRLAPLDDWFRREFLPGCQAETVAVLAGRSPPPTPWRTDPGWRRLMQQHTLAPLDDPDSDLLLAGLGVPPGCRRALSGLGRGHPLVLALLAEVATHSRPPATLADVPDVVARLCQQIFDDLPDHDPHRLGLATCAHATALTADLLRRTVGSDAAEVWAWLQGRPYIRRGTVGLVMHEVVRELFEAEFRHRAPNEYVALHLTVKGYFIERLLDPAEQAPSRAGVELLLLHRKGPLARHIADLRDRGQPPVKVADSAGRETTLALIERHEGAASAALARAWLVDQPLALYTCQADEAEDRFGFAMHTYLPTTAKVAGLDPVTVAAQAAVDRHGPLRPGERIHVNRFSGARGDYRRDPLLFLVGGVTSMLEWAQEPAAWTFIVTLDDDFYGAYFEYLGLARLFTVPTATGQAVGYGWDRRRFPVTSLFELMARRELTGETGPPPAAMVRPRPLSRAEFAAAVRAALPTLAQPDALAGSPLLGTGLTQPAPGTGRDPVAGATALRDLLVTAAGRWHGGPRGEQDRRVLRRTFLTGCPSQEAAADLLDLPFSTYRRHLGQAIDRLVERLWLVETGVLPVSALTDPAAGPGEGAAARGAVPTIEQRMGGDRPVG